jgi:1,4-alpha-glucan branching enzyme
MAKIAVTFRYLSGLKRQIFANARLSGSWDSQGKRSETWT